MLKSFFIRASALLLAATLAACGSAPRTIDRLPESAGATSARGGGYYLDDGPGNNAPANLDAIPDAVPRDEPLRRATMRPYTVMGRSYTPMTEVVPYKARGIATWYGRRYHGKPTSSGELYDMYGMSAAHTVLPIPSYARVTNPANGKSVVVRINDRGPFIDGRLIDLSYTAAWKLGLLNRGSGMVEVESIIPGAAPLAQPPVAAALPAEPVPPPSSPSAAAPPAPTAIPAPAPAAVAAAPAAITPAITASAGSFLQFGAFGVRANAESYLARLQTEADWLAASLHIHHSDGIYRVQAGPYASEAAAREAAERASQMLGAKPVVRTRPVE